MSRPPAEQPLPRKFEEATTTDRRAPERLGDVLVAGLGHPAVPRDHRAPPSSSSMAPNPHIWLAQRLQSLYRRRNRKRQLFRTALTAAGVVALLALTGLTGMLVKPGPNPDPRATPAARVARVAPADEAFQARPPSPTPARPPQQAKPAVATPRLTEEPAWPGPRAFPRRDNTTEQALTDSLRAVSVEVKLDSVKGTSAKLLEEAKQARDMEEAVHPALNLLAQRDDLAGLPARKESECRLEEKEARRMGAVSQSLHRNQLQQVRALARRGSSHSTVQRLETSLVEQTEGRPREAIAALVQILQGEERPARSLLVRVLAQIGDPAATTALARRALFDPSPEVRQQAAAALRPRAKQDYRPVLLDGLRYPWPPVADHAAEALVALEDHEAVSSLVALLDKPNPALPVENGEMEYVVPQLVRVNHLANCMLCHAPSFEQREPIRAPVPTPSQPLPRSGYGDRGGSGPFVRADVTYLKQDFSALHSVPDPDKWPAIQRFDYFIRLRKLSAAEAGSIRRAQQGSAGDRAASYPQREAVLFALRELREKDAGSRVGD